MIRIVSLLLILIMAPIGVAEDWPQWLGPRRDGSSADKVASWSKELKILWKVPVGAGHSSPIVADGRVILHTLAKEATKEELNAYSVKDGKPLWTAAYNRGNFKSLFGNGPRATPVASGGKVYSFGITGLLTCFDAKTGGQQWQRDTLKEMKAKNLFFGASCSPLVEGNLVLVNVGGAGASVVAYNKDDGHVAWQKLDDKASYASPIAIGNGPGRQVIFLTAKGLVSLAPATGKVFWEYPLVDKIFESSTTPVVAGDILFGSSITFGGLGLKMDNDLVAPKVKQAWINPDLNCYFSTPVAIGTDYLYMVTGTKPSLAGLLPGAKKVSNHADLHCVDAHSGKVLWTQSNVGTYHASLLRTGDNKLLMVEEAGNLILLDPSPKEYRELARAKICGKTWAHPGLSNGKFFIRDDTHLLCVQLPSSL